MPQGPHAVPPLARTPADRGPASSAPAAATQTPDPPGAPHLAAHRRPGLLAAGRSPQGPGSEHSPAKPSGSSAAAGPSPEGPARLWDPSAAAGSQVPPRAGRVASREPHVRVRRQGLCSGLGRHRPLARGMLGVVVCVRGRPARCAIAGGSFWVLSKFCLLGLHEYGCCGNKLKCKFRL